MKSQMMRLAFGAKFGKPDRRLVLLLSPAIAAKRLGFNSDPSAAVPIPVAMRPKKWRRVSNRLCSRKGFIGESSQAQSSELKGNITGVESFPVALRSSSLHRTSWTKSRSEVWVLVIGNFH